MVSGINWSSYSANQIVELKNNGVEVPQDVYNQAMAEVTTASNDEQEMSYVITDEASDVNEAEQEVATASEYGATLKNILGTLISKCSEKGSEMKELESDINNYSMQMDKVVEQAEATSTEASSDLEGLEADAEQASDAIAAKQAEIEQKQAEIDALKAEIDSGELDEDASKEKQQKIDDLSGEIEGLNSEIAALQGDISQAASTEDAKKSDVNDKLASMGKTMEDVKTDIQGAMNDTVNAKEYADVTVKKGYEAMSISSRKEAAAGGFGRDMFFGLFKGVGGKREAHDMGAHAIGLGSFLGNHTDKVGETVENIGNQYNISFAKKSEIESITSKEYVDKTNAEVPETPQTPETPEVSDPENPKKKPEEDGNA